jgi:hypothetical protein
MKCDSWASFLAHTFASPCFGRKPKARVVIIGVNLPKGTEEGKLFWSQIKTFNDGF